ncbi:MAG: hypothetical protein Q9M32_00410 [Sulfurimonas sp.]|nr:hypothetical protein [Sulfurimonas sp.]MDQ7061627.1 hypothetical protein [Sulfurimonas sp.]
MITTVRLNDSLDSTLKRLTDALYKGKIDAIRNVMIFNNNFSNVYIAYR